MNEALGDFLDQMEKFKAFEEWTPFYLCPVCGEITLEGFGHKEWCEFSIRKYDYDPRTITIN